MLVQGDDSAIRHSGPRINFATDILALGFEGKCIYHNNLQDLEFCSSFLLPCDKGYVFVPKPGKLLCKFGYFINPPLTVNPKSLIRGVCLGLKHLRFLSIYRRFLDTVEQWCGNVSVFEPPNLEHKYVFSEVASVVETEFFLRERYMMHNELFEKAVASLCSWSFNESSLELIFDRDTDGPKDVYTKL